MLDSWGGIMLVSIFGSTAIAGMSVLRRYCLNHPAKEISVLQYLIHYNIYATLLFATIYLGSTGFNPPKLLSGFWRAVFLAIAANILIQFFNGKAASFARGEISLTAPLQAMTPGLITLAGLLFGEWPSIWGWSGVFLFAAASYLVGWDRTPAKWHHYFIPFQRLLSIVRYHTLTPEERDEAKAVWYSAGSSTLGTFGLLGDGLYTRRGGGMSGLLLGAMTLTAALALSYLLWYAIRPDATEHQREKGLMSGFQKTYMWAIVLVGIGWVASVIFIWPAYNHTFIAYVGTLKRFSVILSVVAGYFFFREENLKTFFAFLGKRRFWAAILIVIGALFISLDDLPTRITTQIETLGF